MMKLLITLIVGLIHFSQPKDCKILGKISKNIKLTTENNYYCVYLDTNEFPDDSEISIKATIYDGSSQEEIMYYIGNDTEPTKDGLYKNLKFYKNTYRKDYIGNTAIYFSYYDYLSSYYNIPKSNYRYLIVSIPYFNAKKSEIEISSPFPIWIIALIVVSGVIVIGIILVIVIRHFLKRRK